MKQAAKKTMLNEERVLRDQFYLIKVDDAYTCYVITFNNKIKKDIRIELKAENNV